MVVELIRLIVVLAFTAGAYQAAGALGDDFVVHSPQTTAFLVTTLGSALGYLVGGLFARSLDAAMRSAERRLASRHASEILAGTVGLLVGLVTGALVAWPLLVALDQPLVTYPLAALILVVLGTFGARFAQRKRLELFGVLGVAPQPATEGGGCLLDSSAAIDGRIIALYRAGLLPLPVWVPSFIIWELQGIADSAYPSRRRRGQRGLEVLSSLREAGAAVRVIDEDPAATTDPDAKLLIVARRRGLPLVTSDANLARAAELQGIRVLSLHALAELLRPPVLPGERVRVRLLKEGRDAGQAVGYLEDGTMVVVERAAGRLGAEVDVEVTSVLQTATGRMLFARMAPAPERRQA